MLSDSDQRKLTAAILRGQESGKSLKTIISSDRRLVTHVDTILHSFSICCSLLHSSSSHQSNKKRKNRSGEEEDKGFEFQRDDSPIPFLDGYSWKKYGQKTIKNSPFQRSYYRCSGRNCEAKKHVQQIQDSPPIFRSTYIGLHTCQAQVFLHSAYNGSESSTMIQFEQASSEHQETDQVVDQEHGNTNNQDFLMNDDEFWVSDELKKMFSYNDYGVDSFRL